MTSNHRVALKDVRAVCSLACADFERNVTAVEKAPDHRRRHLLTSPKLQTVADSLSVTVAPMKAKKKIRVRLEAL